MISDKMAFSFDSTGSTILNLKSLTYFCEVQRRKYITIIDRNLVTMDIFVEVSFTFCEIRFEQSFILVSFRDCVTFFAYFHYIMSYD